MSLRTIVQTLGGDLYDRGRRANIPAPGHSVAYRALEPIAASALVILLVLWLAAGVRGEFRRLEQSVVPDD
ncbi:MAG: hypothetical protein K2X91_00085, partial [Thermoleophilia bacterium]|nr:hypothetical protein [Thermoleophilia bacterium]